MPRLCSNEEHRQFLLVLSKQFLITNYETTLEMIESIEEIVIDFGDICRFCLTETKNDISIHDRCIVEDSKDKDEATIIDFVTKLTSIKMDNLEGLPSLVCENCFSIIKVCLEFRQSCQQSDYTLRDCYEKTLEEAKAKFSLSAVNTNLNDVSEGEKGVDEEVKDIFIKHEMKDEVIGELVTPLVETEESKMKESSDISDNHLVKSVECIVPVNSIDKSESVSVEFQKKQSFHKRNSVPVSVLKAGTIKEKYQRINSLSERLKEAQSKLVADILRTNDIMSSSVNSEKPSGKIRFTCPQCLVSFVSSEMLTYHFITNHVTERKNQSTINIFQCKICKTEFGFMYQLMRHYKKMHKIPVSKIATDHLAPKNRRGTADAGRTHQCLDCHPPKKFNKKKDFLRHLTQHVKVDDNFKRSLRNGAGLPSKYYTCTRCDPNQTFATKYTLVRHLMNIHKLGKNDIMEARPGVGGSGDAGSLEGSNSRIDVEACDPNAKGLNLSKVYVCLDCSPPASFSDDALFIEHKSAFHEKKLECIPLKELRPVYVEAVNVFQRGAEDYPSFKLVCKNCETPTEFFSVSEFVEHMKVHPAGLASENWSIKSTFLLDSLPLAKGRDRVWKCTECPASYNGKHKLHYHMKVKHKVTRTGGVECPEPECDASFLTNLQVVRHGITVHKKYFADLHKALNKKTQEQPGEEDKRIRNFECDLCQKKYLERTTLKRHILDFHLGQLVKEKAICPYCGKTFDKKARLKAHIDLKHEVLRVSCPVCKKDVNLKTMGKHYRTHREKPEFEFDSKNIFVCNQCGKVLKSKPSLNEHLKIHLNVRDQICDICGCGFTTKKGLSLHRKTHDTTQRKLFHCDQCEKAFTGKHTLNRHLLTHSGEKNFICEFCSKNFYTLQELNRHVRYHKKEYRFNCQLCAMRFLDRSVFRHHMMRHRNIRPHKCHFCDKMFIARRKMHLHMSAKHNVEVVSTKAVRMDPKTYIPLDDLL